MAGRRAGIEERQTAEGGSLNAEGVKNAGRWSNNEEVNAGCSE